jgi:hypothetical protein
LPHRLAAAKAFQPAFMAMSVADETETLVETDDDST